MALPSVKRGKSSKYKIKGGTFSMDELKDRFSRAGQGKFIYLKDGENVRVRFLKPPEKWRLFSEHRAKQQGKWTTVPCVGDVCPLDDDDQPSEKVLIPVYDVKQKKVRFIKAGSMLATDAMSKHARGRLLNRDYNYIRTGTELQTRYELDAEDKEKRPETKTLDIPDSDKVLQEEVDRFYGKGKGGSSIKDEDEEENKVGKKRKGKKDEEEEDDDDVETEDDDDDEDDDEEDEDDEDEKPKKKSKSKAKPKKKSKSDDDDEDEDEDDEDEDEDDEDEDEDDDEEEEEAPKKKKGKAKAKKKAKDDDDEDEEDDESDDEDEDEDEDDEEDEEEEEEEDDDEDDDKPAKPKKLKSKKKGKKK